MTTMQTVCIDNVQKSAQSTAASPSQDGVWEFFIDKIGPATSSKGTYGPWTCADPCGHGSYTITLTKLREIGPLDCIWSFHIAAQDGAHALTRVTLAHYCDMDAACSSAAHNGPVPVEVFPAPCTFAASWNAYVAFNLFRHCDPHASS